MHGKSIIKKLPKTENLTITDCKEMDGSEDKQIKDW